MFGGVEQRPAPVGHQTLQFARFQHVPVSSAAAGRRQVQRRGEPSARTDASADPHEQGAVEEEAVDYQVVRALRDFERRRVGFQIRVGRRAVRWFANEIYAWVESRPRGGGPA